MSIGHKLTRLLFLTCAIPLLLVSALLVFFEYREEHAATAGQLNTLAAIIASHNHQGELFRDRRMAGQMLTEMRADAQVLTACLHDRDGALVAEYRAGHSVFGCPARPFPPGARREGRTLVLSSDVALDGARVGSITLRSDLRQAFSRVVDYLELLPCLLLLALAVTAPVSIRLQRAITRPIRRLAAIASTVSVQKDYSLRVAPGGPDEIGSLIDAFNNMLAEVERNAGELRQMNARLDLSRRTAEEAAEALAKSEARFHSTFDEGPVGMVIITPDGAILEANRFFQQLLGYSREELLRASIYDITHPDDRAETARNDRRVLSGRVDRSQLNKRYLTREGETVWARLTASRMPGADDKPLLIGMIEDLREQKALEAQFQQAQKMEAIGRLAGGVAHDFNNLLTVVKGNAELLLRRGGPENPMQRNLAQIRKAADRAATLVDQLLTFSRKQMAAPRALELNPSLREMTRMLGPLIGEDIDVSLELSSSPAYITCDAVQLEQIVFNLAVNARDAMPSGGRLTLRTELRRPDLIPQARASAIPDRYVCLSVTDTGAGIAKELQTRIFEPFFTTKEVGKGTGLGLSTVYGLVQHAGGWIEVTSAIGHGSTFAIWLPLVEAGPATSQAETAPAAGAAAPSETILLVEDEQLVRAILCETLSEVGYQVLEARDPEHALDIAASRLFPIDLLLTDIVMPQINGCELSGKVRASHPAIRLLFISGYSDKALPPGGHFLKKPFTPEDLMRAVRTALDDSFVCGSGVGTPAAGLGTEPL